MILLNFGHPITEEQKAGVAGILGTEVARVIDVPTQFDVNRSFVEQGKELVSLIPLDPVQWQTEPILVNLPSLSVIAGVVLAEVHGLMGHFPAVLRLRPVLGSVPMVFEVVEIIDLQGVRDEARKGR